MKRIGIVVIAILALVIPINPSAPNSAIFDSQDSIQTEPSSIMSDLGGLGDSISTELQMFAAHNDKQFLISNSFSDLQDHSGFFNVTDYQIPGWDLYRTVLQVDNITAAPERNNLWIDSDIKDYFKLEYKSGDAWDALSQGFYNKPFDSRLLNYSVYCYMDTLGYSLPDYGNLFLDVREDFTNFSTSISTPYSLPSINGAAWYNVSSDVLLERDNEYFIVLNGTWQKCIDYVEGNGPVFYWYSYGDVGSFQTWRHRTDPPTDYWDKDENWEGFLNYTYIPWNTTSDSPLVYPSPTNVSLLLNGVPTSASIWSFSGSNVTGFSISTLQSVYVNYDLQLWYKKSVEATTVWFPASEPSKVGWNVTTDTSYPVLTCDISRNYWVIPHPEPWDRLALYNSSTPDTPHPGQLVDTGQNHLWCNDLTNGTWTVVFESHNYVTSMLTLNQSTGLPIDHTISVYNNVDINCTLQDELGQSVELGNASLSIRLDGSIALERLGEPVTAGEWFCLWNISETTQGFGLYDIEFTWCNGTEAGYRKLEVVTTYPTELTGPDTIIADSGADIYETVHFKETFSNTSLDDVSAIVRYSVDGGSNLSMSYLGDGDWQLVMTPSDLSPGIHIIDVYAEGIGLINRTRQIVLQLTYLSMLEVSFDGPEGGNITNLQTVNLTVAFSMSNGTPIVDATINVTSSGTTWALHYDDLQGKYWIQFNGSDFSDPVTTLDLEIVAWKLWYQPQTNSSMSLIIRMVSNLLVEYDSLEIYYDQETNVTSSLWLPNGTLLDADIRIIVNGMSMQVYEPSNGEFVFIAKGYQIGIGTHNLTIVASFPALDTSIREFELVVNAIPVSLVHSGEYTLFVNSSTIIQLEYSDMRDHSPLLAESIDVSWGSSYNLYLNGVGEYILELTSLLLPVGIYQAIVNMTLPNHMPISVTIDIEVLPLVMSILIESEFIQYQEENVTVSLVLIDTVQDIPVRIATVTLLFNSRTYLMEFQAGLYNCTFHLDAEPDAYLLMISAECENYLPAQAESTIVIVPKRTLEVMLVPVTQAAPGDTVLFEAYFQYSDNGDPMINTQVFFEVEVSYANGTTEIITIEAITNSEGIAQVYFTIPFDGELAPVSITYRANCFGSRDTSQASSSSETLSPIMGPLQQLITFASNGFGIAIFLGLIIVSVVTTRVRPLGQEIGEDSDRTVRLEKQLADFMSLESLNQVLAISLLDDTCITEITLRGLKMAPNLMNEVSSVILRACSNSGSEITVYNLGMRFFCFRGSFIVLALTLDRPMTHELGNKARLLVEMIENTIMEDEAGGLILDSTFQEEIEALIYSVLEYEEVVPHVIAEPTESEDTRPLLEKFLINEIGLEMKFLIRDQIDFVADLFKYTKAEALDAILDLKRNGRIKQARI
jgi:hypothetical protein